MQDALIKGTGNSRYLKSVADFLTLYPTYEAFAQALAQGTLPIDLNGINELGWDTLGTALNKANLLKDTTASALGLTSAAVPDEALLKLNMAVNEKPNFSDVLWVKLGEMTTAVEGEIPTIVVRDVEQYIQLKFILIQNGAHNRWIYWNGVEVNTFFSASEGTATSAVGEFNLYPAPEGLFFVRHGYMTGSNMSGQTDTRAAYFKSADTPWSGDVTVTAKRTSSNGYPIGVGSQFLAYALKR